MPVPSTINDLSTTAGSNYPQGTDTPTTGDDVIRALSSFIASLRDLTNGTTSGPTLKDAVFTGTPTGLRTPLVAYKTAATSRSSTTTVADDPHLVIALTPGTWSLGGLFGFYGTTTGTQGIKMQLAFSGTQTAFFANLTGNVNSSASDGNLYLSTPGVNLYGTISALSTQVDYLSPTGFIVVTVAGNLSLQWAQNSSSANATNVVLGSYMTCMKVS